MSKISFLEKATPEELFVVNSTKVGHKSKVACPWCTPERSKTRKDLTVTAYEDRVVFSCWHCTLEGLIVTKPKNDTPTRQPYSPPRDTEKPREKRTVADLPPLQAHHVAFLRMRGISAEIAQKYRVFGHDKAYYHAAGAVQQGLGFPNFGDPVTDITAAQFRSIESKNFSAWQAAESFYGIEHVTAGEDLYIVEGPLDMLAMAEAGFNAISVPNGAPKTVSDEDRPNAIDDKKYRYVWSAKEKIDAAKRVFMAVDTDGPGEALAEELARRIGKAKCWKIKWVGGKDANDVLLAMGPEGIQEQVADAEPWPVAGLYDAEHFRQQVYDLYDKGLGKGASTGFAGVDELYTVAEGQVTIVTGIPSSGKSEFIDMIAINLADKLDWSFCVCSFENEPRLHIAKLVSKRSSMPFFKNSYGSRLNKHGLDEAFEWVDAHFVFGYQDDGTQSDIDSILERIRISVMRYGVRGAIVDPYNYIARDKSNNESEWVSDMLTKVKVFASAHGVHIWLVAHPTKLQRNAEGRYSPPTGYDISGSAHWFNKADIGLTVHREKESPLEVQIIIWKCRFSWVGKQGQAQVIYDVSTTRYYEPQTVLEGEGVRYSAMEDRDIKVPFL